MVLKIQLKAILIGYSLYGGQGILQDHYCLRSGLKQRRVLLWLWHGWFQIGNAEYGF